MAAMKPRLVATDLDGTVVRRDLTMTPRTVAALQACVDAGVDLVFVTGRPPRWMQPVVDATGHTGTAVCANGALVYDLVTERVLRAHTLAADDAREAVARVRHAIGPVNVALETLDGYAREPGYQTRWDAISDQRVGALDELLDGDPSVVKLLIRQETSTSDAMLAAVEPALAGLAQPTHSNERDCLLEISALGVSKASTLAEIATERGIEAADVVAFGDMPNDLAMLEWAGRGYAMADGHPDAIAVAHAIAPPCVEDGVAQVLEALLAHREPPVLTSPR
jgi:Cof subfamily protein (haloacid dehalogenase superfamily)